MRRRGSFLSAMVMAVAALGVASIGCGGHPVPSPFGAAPEVEATEDEANVPSSQRTRVPDQRFPELGITGRPTNTNPRGLLVTGFLPSAQPWPLQVLGVREGDVLVMCDWHALRVGHRVAVALDRLRNHGEPFVLVVFRGEETVTLRGDSRLLSALGDHRLGSRAPGAVGRDQDD